MSVYAAKDLSLISKSANRFRVGEVLYLHGAYSEIYRRTFRGPFLIQQIKHQSSDGVSFYLTPAYPALPGALANNYQPWTQPHETYLLEFLRTAKLCRMRGFYPCTYVIEEIP